METSPKSWSRRWLLERLGAVIAGAATAEATGIIASRAPELAEKGLGEVKGTEPPGKHLIINFLDKADTKTFLPSFINDVNFGGNATIFHITDEGDPQKALNTAAKVIIDYVAKHGTLTTLSISAHGEDNQIWVGTRNSETSFAATDLMAQLFYAQKDSHVPITKKLLFEGCEVFQNYLSPSMDAVLSNYSIFSGADFRDIAAVTGWELEGAQTLATLQNIHKPIGEASTGFRPVETQVTIRPDKSVQISHPNEWLVQAENLAELILDAGLPMGMAVKGLTTANKALGKLGAEEQYPVTESLDMPTSSSDSGMTRREFFRGGLGRK